jgi:hypothetical protein
MLVQATDEKEGLRTLRAAKPGLLSVMNSHVNIQVTLLSKSFGALQTRKGFIPSNSFQMRIQLSTPSEGLGTMSAAKRFLASVH